MMSSNVETIDKDCSASNFLFEAIISKKHCNSEFLFKSLNIIFYIVPIKVQPETLNKYFLIIKKINPKFLACTEMGEPLCYIVLYYTCYIIHRMYSLILVILKFN
jgi:hypothetical protein